MFGVGLKAALGQMVAGRCTAFVRKIAGLTAMVAMAGLAAGIFTAPVRGQADASGQAATQSTTPPVAAPAVPAGPAPVRLDVDARQAPQKILHAREHIPVQPGPLTLYYPEWIPGEHMPDGPIINLVGMKFMNGDQLIPWRRDLVEMFSIHLNVPEGVTTLDAQFDFLLSAPTSGFSAGASATASLDVLSWNQVLLYPSGSPAKDIPFVASLRLPAGWKYGTALPVTRQDGDTIQFAQVPLTTLVDSPVLSGRFFRAIQLTPGQNPPHEIDIAADSQAALAITPDTELHLRNLIAETGTLFGGVRHYRDYHFLLTLSDDVAHFGLEHHESSDDRTSERSLIDEGQLIEFAGLLPHEFVHSWNGKYRRPDGLSTPDYQTPMKDDLLWVYEGLTEYLGEVLTARSGLLSDEQARESLAYTVAIYMHRPGREWRPLQDTADAAPFLYDATFDWSNWRRGTDFYEEGAMLWLDVDSKIRSLTGDKKSINDFCKVFHGGGVNGMPELKPYNFDEVVSTLNGVAPNDWAAFLRSRLDGLATKLPIDALANSGWKLIYNDQPNEIMATQEAEAQRADFTFTVGATVANDGTVLDVIHGGTAYDAGLAPGMKIIAVNGQQYSPDGLRDIISAAKTVLNPMQFIVANGAQFKTISMDYHDGLKYPHIERDGTKPDYLGEIYHATTH
jgi:predicted metalloprotease with PDZ domain